MLIPLALIILFPPAIIILIFNSEARNKLKGMINVKELAIEKINTALVIALALFLLPFAILAFFGRLFFYPVLFQYNILVISFHLIICSLIDILFAHYIRKYYRSQKVKLIEKISSD